MNLFSCLLGLALLWMFRMISASSVDRIWRMLHETFSVAKLLGDGAVFCEPTTTSSNLTVARLLSLALASAGCFSQRGPAGPRRLRRRAIA